jgi:drug/metabolite transporter (DMT)-like permease
MGARVAGTALGFYGCLTIINGLIFTGIIVKIRPNTTTQLLKRHLPVTLFGGGISFLAYALVIWSFTNAPIALVAALRETSVIFALLLGVFVLKEKLTGLKVFAVVLTLTGTIMLRIG